MAFDQQAPGEQWPGYSIGGKGEEQRNVITRIAFTLTETGHVISTINERDYCVTAVFGDHCTIWERDCDPLVENPMDMHMAGYAWLVKRLAGKV